jgi:hypothetical protein
MFYPIRKEAMAVLEARGFNMTQKHEDKVEELMAELLEYEDEEIVDALVQSGVVNGTSGKLSDWWLNLLDPEIKNKERDEAFKARKREDLLLEIRNLFTEFDNEESE